MLTNNCRPSVGPNEVLLLHVSSVFFLCVGLKPRWLLVFRRRATRTESPDVSRSETFPFENRAVSYLQLHFDESQCLSLVLYLLHVYIVSAQKINDIKCIIFAVFTRLLLICTISHSLDPGVLEERCRTVQTRHKKCQCKDETEIEINELRLSKNEL